MRRGGGCGSLLVVVHRARRASERAAPGELGVDGGNEVSAVIMADHLCDSAAIGLDTSGESLPYIAGWGEANDMEAIRRYAETVDTIARTLEARSRDARHARHGAVGVHWTKGVQRSSVTSLVQPPDSPVEQAWRYAHETLTDLGVEAPRYLHLMVGVPLPAPAFVARGDVFGPTEAGLASIERELRRAGGEMILEDEPEP